MTGIYGPTWPIDGPPPEPRPFSLLTAARVVPDIDADEIERFANGVAVYPYPPDDAHVWDACSGGSDVVKETGGVMEIPEFGAMVAYLAITCSSMGIFGAGISKEEAQRRFVARAEAAFAAVESAAIEREFLNGTLLPGNPHLADGNGSFPWGDTATSVVNGLALLENEIGAKTGMIHVSPALALAADAAHVVRQDGRYLRTINGTIVVPGAGYAGGDDPEGQSAASAPEEWAYATGPVEIRRSGSIILPGSLEEALDRGVNTITFRVERYYVVDWDTVVQAAVLIDRCSTACGEAPS